MTENSFVKSIISMNNQNQTSSQKRYFSLYKSNSKKMGLSSLGTKLLGDARSQVLIIRINLC